VETLYYTNPSVVMRRLLFSYDYETHLIASVDSLLWRKNVDADTMFVRLRVTAVVVDLNVV